MAQQTINVGTAPNDGTGTPLRTAFQYTNSNFSELYTALGGGSGLPGASTQVLFNNGTNIAGDAGLVYNSTTDALTIGGNVQAASATITGAANLNGAVNLNTAGNSTVLLGSSAGYGVLSGSGTNAASIYINGATRPGFNSVLQFGAAEHQWYNSSLSSLIATLNTTGLGVGASPSHRLTVSGTAATNTTGLGLIGTTTGYNRVLINNTSGGGQFGVEGSSGGNLCVGSTAYSTVVGSYQNYSLHFITNNNVQATIDASGNVGIGVTPSAWASYKALQVGSIGSLSSITGATIVGNNWFYDGASKYITTAASTIYEQGAGTHAWYSAASGTAGTAVSFGSAKMTLDASGNLLVGTTSSPAGAKVGAIAKLSGVSAEGTASINVSTTPVALSRATGTSGLFFVMGYNASGGAGGWYLVASTGGGTPTVISSGGTPGLTLTFTMVGGQLNAQTASGTFVANAFAITA